MNMQEFASRLVQASMDAFRDGVTPETACAVVVTTEEYTFYDVDIVYDNIKKRVIVKCKG